MKKSLLKPMIWFIISLLSLIATTPIAYGKDNQKKDYEEHVSEDNLKEKELTPISKQQLVQVLIDSHIVVFNTEPSKSRLAAAWAQIALENGQGKYVWNYNLGNIGPGYKKQHSYYMHTRSVPYRSFSGFLAGGIAYWKVLRKCSLALHFFDSTDPKSATHALKRCGYFQANIEPYTKGLIQLFWKSYNHVLPKYYEQQF